MAVKNSQLEDLLQCTLDDLPSQEFEVMWDNPEYEFCRIYQNERIEIDGGNNIQRRVMLDHNGAARYRRLYDTDDPAVNDVMQTITVPWCQIGTNYSWDKREIMRNANSAKGFIRLMDTRRIDGLWSLADLIEERAWKTPTSATDDLYPYGVPYYLNMLDADATTAGFNGQTIRYQDGTTGTSCAGLDASTNEKWKNYAATYTDVDASMIDTFRIAFMRTKFKAPLIVKDPASARSAAKRCYAGYELISKLMRLADEKDDNHSGKDIMSNLRVDDGGNVMINRLPVVYVSELDDVTDIVTSDAVDPLYCIDFSKFIPVVHDGDWMEESEPMSDRRQHTTFTVFLDGSHNNLCLNRRKAGFVIHKPITS
jgi:hypothetical protein